METLALFSFLSFLVTKSVDTVRNAVDLRDSFPKVIWNFASFGFGLLYAFVFSANVFPAIGLHPKFGVLLTGFVLGSGGSFGHELLDWLSAKGHTGNPKAPNVTPPA